MNSLGTFSRVGLFLLFATAIAAGPPSDRELTGLSIERLFPDARFDPSIPTQAELLGVEPGARPLRHDELLRYLEALAEASPRARLSDYSLTHEGRRMVVLVVSDEDSIAGLNQVRAEHARIVDPRGRPASEDAAALEHAKAVAWMAYGIQGDELSSVDAAAAVAYRLVAGEDDLTRKMRSDRAIH